MNGVVPSRASIRDFYLTSPHLLPDPISRIKKKKTIYLPLVFSTPLGRGGPLSTSLSFPLINPKVYTTQKHSPLRTTSPALRETTYKPSKKIIDNLPPQPLLALLCPFSLHLRPFQHPNHKTDPVQLPKGTQTHASTPKSVAGKILKERQSKIRVGAYSLLFPTFVGI